jgi:hypothetical protein
VVRRVNSGNSSLGLFRANYLKRTLLVGSAPYWDLLLLVELSLLGKILEIPEVLFQVRSYSGNSVAVASREQGTSVVFNPFRANRKTRKTLLEWNDPSASGHLLWLPLHAERCWEYMKRVHHVPLTPVQKALCYLTVPTVFYWTRFKVIGGAWKRKLGLANRGSR